MDTTDDGTTTTIRMDGYGYDRMTTIRRRRTIRWWWTDYGRRMDGAEWMDGRSGADGRWTVRWMDDDDGYGDGGYDDDDTDGIGSR